MNLRKPARVAVSVALGLTAWTLVTAESTSNSHHLPNRPVEASADRPAAGPVATIDARALGTVIERAMDRYFVSRGVSLYPNGELAGLIAEEIAALSVAEAAPLAGNDYVSAGGSRVNVGGPDTRGVLAEDVELSLAETGSGPGDRVQLVFRTPEYDGDPVSGDAWSINVSANDTASVDDGTMSFSTPSYFDALLLFTDGSAIVGEQREMTLRKLSTPPTPSGVCGSLQEGVLYWDDDANALCVCDGTAWDTVDGENAGSCN